VEAGFFGKAVQAQIDFRSILSEGEVLAFTPGLNRRIVDCLEPAFHDVVGPDLAVGSAVAYLVAAGGLGEIIGEQLANAARERSKLGGRNDSAFAIGEILAPIESAVVIFNSDVRYLHAEAVDDAEAILPDAKI
jgi:hypothetical protein